MSMRSKLLLPRQRFILLRWLVVAALLSASGAVAYRNYRDTLTHDAVLQRQAGIRAKLARSVLPPPVTQSPEEIKQWKSLQTELEFPWVAMFHAIDEATTADIELLELSPEKGGRRLKLHGEARSQEALIAYLDALREQEILHTVFLVKREDMTRGDLTSVDFVIESRIR